MSLDLKITGGFIVDGTGSCGYHADIGIRDGVITEIGTVSQSASQEINADGALVTPGFIDMHTHYDCQAFWDGELLPSSLHGVTTAFVGNCGIGCAPCNPGDEQRLAGLLSGVEDIPESVLRSHVPWSWRTFPEYLHALEQIPRAINLGAQVTHAPVRFAVMRERAMANTRATSNEIEQMRAIVGSALAAGAFGFSTGRIAGHFMANGNHTPEYGAPTEELVRIVSVLKELPHRVVQFASDFQHHLGMAGADEELKVIEAVAAAAGRPVGMHLFQWPLDEGEGWREIVRRVEALNAGGLQIRFEACSRAIGWLLGLDVLFHPFLGFPSYRGIRNLPLPERVARMREPSFRRQLLAEHHVKIEELPAATRNDLLANLENMGDGIFVFSGKPNYEPTVAESVGAIARRSGKTPREVLYDAMLVEDSGASLLYVPVYNFQQGDLRAVHEMLSNPLTLVGLGDGGAHSATVCDTAFTTFNLTHWARDRAAGPTIPLERIVHLMSGAQANYFGLKDRGRLLVGQRADLNVIDHQRLTLQAPRTVRDLPGDEPRLMQRATGYVATVLDGVQTVHNDELIGAKPGKVLRAA